MFTTNIEKMIIEKLRLYANVRTKAEDDAIYQEACDRLLMETLIFINEHALTPSTDQRQQDLQENIRSLLSRLYAIPDWQQKLSIRLNQYIDNWIIQGR